MSKPRIDSFGNIQIGAGPAFRGRVIQTGPTTFAIFPEHAEPAPFTLELDEEFRIKGRNLTGTVNEEGFVFQRASCGCQTPQHLRGPGRRFLATLEPADA